MTRFSVLLACAFAMTAAACASSRAVPRPFPGAPVASAPKTPKTSVPGSAPEDTTTRNPAASASAPAGATAGKPYTPSTDAPAAPLAPPALSAPLEAHHYDGQAVAEYALAFRGVPYRFGGSDPAGFDCSGLVHYVFLQYGINLPRIVGEQWQVGEKVKPSEIKPGDLLFFSTKGPGATHVAIAVDSGHFVHAPNSTGVVRVEALSSTYWGSHYIGAKRIGKSSTSN